MPPTLFKKGSLRYTGYGPKQEVLDTYRPIDYILGLFEKKLQAKAKSPADRMFLILSGTGTGKSTVMPAYIYYKFFKQLKKTIGVTQPRVLTAKSIAQDMSETYSKRALKERGDNSDPLVLGENLGFKTQYFRVVPSEGILYMTAGTLLQQFNTLSDEAIIDKYSFIIIDEAHTLQTDVVNTIEAAKKFIHRCYDHPKCPILILTTGTFDVKYYTDYMLNGIEDRYDSMVIVEGSSYPKTEIFLDYSSTNMYNTAMKIAMKINTENTAEYGPVDPKLIKNAEDYIKGHLIDGGAEPMMDVLIFISGGEGMELIKRIGRITEKVPLMSQYPYKALLLNSSAVASENTDYMEAAEKPTSAVKVKIKDKFVQILRKFIISTNVAETGLTLPGLKYVIDMGWVQENKMDPTFGAYIMTVSPVNKASHTQRKGRVGRIAPGTCYTMFTEKSFNMMREQGYPPNVTTDSAIDILCIIIREIDKKGEINKKTLKELNGIKFNEIIDIVRMDLLFKPPIDMYTYCLEKLFVLGAIDSNCMPTITGLIMSKVRKVTIECIKMILAGLAYKVPMIYIINLAAIISSEHILNPPDDTHILPNVMFINKRRRHRSYSKLYRMVADPYIYSMIILTHILGSDDIYKTSNDMGIQFESLSMLLTNRDELINNLASIGINPLGNYRDMHSYRSVLEFVSEIKLCVYEGYKMNLCIWDGTSYRDRRTGMSLKFKSQMLFNENEIEALGETNPQIVLHYGLNFSMSRKNIYYEVGDNTRISVMSGYVPVDLFYDAI